MRALRLRLTANPYGCGSPPASCRRCRQGQIPVERAPGVEILAGGGPPALLAGVLDVSFDPVQVEILAGGGPPALHSHQDRAAVPGGVEILAGGGPPALPLPLADAGLTLLLRSSPAADRRHCPTPGGSSPGIYPLRSSPAADRRRC